jgi:hypothetical protein
MPPSLYVRSSKDVRSSKVVHCNRTGRSNRILRGSASAVSKHEVGGKPLPPSL